MQNCRFASDRNSPRRRSDSSKGSNLNLWKKQSAQHWLYLEQTSKKNERKGDSKLFIIQIARIPRAAPRRPVLRRLPDRIARGLTLRHPQRSVPLPDPHQCPRPRILFKRFDHTHLEPHAPATERTHALHPLSGIDPSGRSDRGCRTLCGHLRGRSSSDGSTSI